MSIKTAIEEIKQCLAEYGAPYIQVHASAHHMPNYDAALETACKVQADIGGRINPCRHTGTVWLSVDPAGIPIFYKEAPQNESV